jgi:hypothetical protein
LRLVCCFCHIIQPQAAAALVRQRNEALIHPKQLLAQPA